MFFKLLKELPLMFAIAALTWGIVFLFFVRDARKKEVSFFTKFKTTIIAILLSILLTATDIWFFTKYVPTHFKKQPVVNAEVSVKELLSDSLIADSTHKTAPVIIKKDSTSNQQQAGLEFKGNTYLTNNASVKFLSRGSSEDIEATNSTVACSLNSTTGQIKFTGLIRGFVFENELMQEHFNDKDYMNSEAFPKTSFSGSVQNISAVNFQKDGTYNATASGALSIHGVTKNISANGQIIIAGKKVSLKSVFKIKRLDFGLNTDEIADELEITVIALFQ